MYRDSLKCFVLKTFYLKKIKMCKFCYNSEKKNMFSFFRPNVFYRIHTFTIFLHELK